jgi:heptosyltransferase-3
MRGGALGDVLLGIPAWRVVRDASPIAPLVISVPGAVADLVLAAMRDRASHSVTVIGADDAAVTWIHGTGPAQTSEVIPEWAAVDVAVAWTRRHRDVGPRLLGAGVGRVVAADPFPSAGSRLHAADWLSATLEQIGLVVPNGWDDAPWLCVPDAQSFARVVSHERPVAVVHPGSGSTRKCWPTERWRATIDALVADEWAVTILEGEADSRAVEAIFAGPLVSGSWLDAVTAIRGEGLGAVAARLATASVVIANDSGIAHLAAGVGAPVVAVFGPTDPATWRPRGPRVAVVGGTPGAMWPHASSVPPEGAISWPEVDEVLRAVATVSSLPPSTARSVRGQALTANVSTAEKSPPVATGSGLAG